MRRFWSDRKAEVYTIVRLSAPVSTGFLLNKLVSFVSVIMVGHLGPAELAAAALGSSLINVTGNSVLAGLAGAMSTLCGQAYGAESYHLVGHVWQRAMIILALICIPICGVLLATEKLLLLGGQTPAVAVMTAAYVRWSLPGIWAYAAFITANNYLQAQRIVRPQVVTSAVVLAIHPPLNWLCIHTLGLGYRGAAMATSISLWLQFCTLLFYIVFLKKGESTWPGWSKECLRDWWPFVKLAVPSMLLISEWWASEAAVMMGGLLPDAQRQLSAMAIYQTTNAMCFMLPLGIAVAVSTRVSNELGAGNSKTAEHSTKVGLFLTLATATCLNVPIFFLRKQWGALFSSDPQLAALIAQTLTVLAFYIVLDGLSVVLGGVIRGAGKQLLASPCVILSYYALGLPAAAYFAFKCGLGVRGLCLGTLLGTAVHAGSFYCLVWKLDWDLEAHRAAARVKGGKAVALQTILTSDASTESSVLLDTEPELGTLDSGVLNTRTTQKEADEENERAGLLAGAIASSVLSVNADVLPDGVVSDPDTGASCESIHLFDTASRVGFP